MNYNISQFLNWQSTPESPVCLTTLTIYSCLLSPLQLTVTVSNQYSQQVIMHIHQLTISNYTGSSTKQLVLQVHSTVLKSILRLFNVLLDRP